MGCAKKGGKDSVVSVSSGSLSTILHELIHNLGAPHCDDLNNDECIMKTNDKYCGEEICEDCAVAIRSNYCN